MSDQGYDPEESDQALQDRPEFVPAAEAPASAQGLLRQRAWRGGRWLLLALMLLLAFLGCGALSLLTTPPIALADTRSRLVADYRPWPLLQFNPVDPALIADMGEREASPATPGHAAGPPGWFWWPHPESAPTQAPGPSSTSTLPPATHVPDASSTPVLPQASPTSTASRTPTDSPTAPATDTPTPSPTATLTGTATSTPTRTPSRTPTRTPTRTPSRTSPPPTRTAAPTSNPGGPSDTPTWTPIPAIDTPTWTLVPPTDTSTPLPTDTPTWTPIPPTDTPLPTATATPTATNDCLPRVASGLAGFNIGGDLGGLRLKSFANTSSQEVYLGVPSLGSGSNRVGQDLTWPGSGVPVPVNLTYDASLDHLQVTVGTAPTLTYANFSSQTMALGKTIPTNAMNAFEIAVTLRDAGSNLALRSVVLNGNSLGDFPGTYSGTTTSSVTNIYAGGGFVLTGNVVSSGTFGGSESSKIEIIFGANTSLPPACGQP